MQKVTWKPAFNNMILALIDFIWFFAIFPDKEKKQVSCKLNRTELYFCYESMRNNIMIKHTQKHEKGFIIMLWSECSQQIMHGPAVTSALAISLWVCCVTFILHKSASDMSHKECRSCSVPFLINHSLTRTLMYLRLVSRFGLTVLNFSRSETRRGWIFGLTSLLPCLRAKAHNPAFDCTSWNVDMNILSKERKTTSSK